MKPSPQTRNTPPSEVQRDLENGFIVTGSDESFKRIKRKGDELSWVFKHGYEGYAIFIDGNRIEQGGFSASINFSDLSDDTISDVIDTFYGSKDNLLSQCDGSHEQFALAICEGYYDLLH